MAIAGELKSTYDSLLKEMKKLNGITVEEKESYIHIRSKGVFLGIHPRKEYLILQIVSAAPIKSARVVKTDQVSKTRFHNHIRLSDPKQIDSELTGWLKESHKLMS